jgi:oligosaccharyltransferase complex subunit alpha (ribophorin I)
VHYLSNTPILTIVEAKRTARVSHWRNKLTVRDDFWLRNDAAKLKGHFSRVHHQRSVLMQRAKTHALTNVVMHLPPGADEAYFVDESGNVSTSAFRRAPPSQAHAGTPAHLLSDLRASILDFKPRYPLLGGWNYTCSVGWSVRLTDGWLKPATEERESRRYSVQVPFMAAVKDVAVDDATLRIVLPEGAKDVTFKVPFGVEVQQERQWSFLDTMGKPVLTLHKRNCSERHGALIKIDYTLTITDQYRKLIVALLAGLFIGSTVRLTSKVNLSIK